MKPWAWRTPLLVLFGFCALAGTVLAQTPQKQTLVCESLNKERKECPARIRGGVRVVRLLGSTKCIAGMNWTWNANGIVVTNNCRAEFEYEPEAGTVPAPGAVISAEAQRQAYDAGYRRGQDDARGGMSRNPERYSREYNSASEQHFRRGYNEGFDAREQGYQGAGQSRWSAPQSDAYDRGYSAGERDSRDRKNRNYKRYSREIDRSTESYFRDGYEDAYDGRPRANRSSGRDSSEFGSATTVTCESHNQKLTECRIEEGSDVQLARQLSETRCVRGESWGVRRNLIWVDRGCRAEFTVRAPAERNSGTAASATSITCESNYNDYKECPVDERSDVRLVRQLSRTQCVQGQSWGTKRGAIWVDRGCRAEFEVTPRLGRENAAGGSVSTLRCESEDGKYRECRIEVGSDVRFRRQLSNAQCIVGQSWGTKRGFVWVDRGCRAEFEVRAPR